MTGSRNRRLSSSQQAANYQSAFDGNDLVLNFNSLVDDFGLAESAGIKVDRSSISGTDARFYWDEANNRWSTEENLQIPRLHLDVTNQITGTFATTDPLVIGLSTKQNLGIDNDTLQSRNPTNPNGLGLLEINPFGGPVRIGNSTLLQSSDVNIYGFDTKVSAFDSLTLTTALSNANEEINITTVGYISLDASSGGVIELSAEYINLNGQVKVNGEDLLFAYRQPIAPTEISNPELGNNNFWFNTTNNTLNMYQSSTLTWIDIYDAGTF